MEDLRIKHSEVFRFFWTHISKQLLDPFECNFDLDFWCLSEVHLLDSLYHFLPKANKNNSQTKQESLAMFHVCKIPTEQFFCFVFKSFGFQTSKLVDWHWKSQRHPHSCSSPAAPARQVPSFIPCLYWSFPASKASSSHESLLSQSHLSRIQFPKIDVNTVSSPLSLGILSKLWINWGIELALRRVTLSSVAEVQHCLAIPSPGQLWF